jgi:hypothetical protein
MKTTLNLPAPQFLFNYIANHLLTQNKKSQGYSKDHRDFDDVRCLYRGPDGLKCAAGAVITDDVYSADFERIGVWSIEKDDKVFTLSLGRTPTEREMDMLQKLQSIHDTKWPESWSKELKKAADEFGLTFNF